MEGPWGTFGASGKKWQWNITVFSFLVGRFIHPPTNLREPLLIAHIYVGLRGVKKVQELLFHREPAAQHHVSHSNQRWWNDGAKDALTQWQIGVFFASFLSCPMAYYSENFGIHEQADLPITAEAASNCMSNPSTCYQQEALSEHRPMWKKVWHIQQRNAVYSGQFDLSPINTESLV